MNKNRLEAFSDGVIAIILTIMVLGLTVPHGNDLAALNPVIPIFASYILSFLFVGIYWVNHHHLLQVTQKVDGRALWMNLHLLFWLSLIPFCTAWLANAHFAPWPVAVYGIVLLAAAMAYFFLAHALAGIHGPHSALARALGRDFKGKISILIYMLAVALAFWEPWVSYGLYVVVALLWLVPDSRIEKLKEYSENI